jgi:hypothetical protein
MDSSGVRSTAIALSATCALALACGESDLKQPSSSGTAMVRRSEPASVNTAPSVTGIRFVPSTAVPGARLQAVAVASDPDGDAITLEFEWEVGGQRILSDGAEIVVPAADKGSTIRVSVVASDEFERGMPAYLETQLGNRPPRITQLDIETVEMADGLPIEPHWEVHPSVVDPDGDHTSFRFEWVVNGVVADVDGSRFAKSNVRRGDRIQVRVVAFDGQTESLPLESTAITIGNSAPEIISSPPGLDPSGVFDYAPKIVDHDHDLSFAFRLIEGPEGMTIDEQTGALAWRPGIDQSGSHPVKFEVADADGAYSRQSFELTVQVEGLPPGPASPR